MNSFGPRFLAAFVLLAVQCSVANSFASALLVTSNMFGGVARFDMDTGAFIDITATGGTPSTASGGRGLTYGPDGNLYVVHQTFSSIQLYDGVTGAFIRTFATGMSNPYGVTFGPDGNLYVADDGTHGVSRFDGTTGQFIDYFVPSNSGGVFLPYDIAFGPDGRLYVAEQQTGVVKRYDGLTGAFIDDFVPPGAHIGAWGLAFSADGDLFITTGTSVQRFDGTTGAALGTFSGGIGSPRDLAFGPDGHLYVVDRLAGVWRFDGSSGSLLGLAAGTLFGGQFIEFQNAIDPILSTTPSDGGIVDFGNVLVGSSAIESISAINVGDPGSTLNGLFPAATGEFGPGSTSGFSLPQGSSTNRDYTYSPTARGSDNQNITITSNGGDSTISLTGNGVAPLQETTHTDAPLTRIGTSSTLPPDIAIANNGDGNLSGLGSASNLNGSIDTGTDGRFVGGGTSFSLPDHTSTSVPTTYSPTTHSVDTSTFTVDYSNGSADGTNQAETVQVAVSGQGVGPTYESNPTPGSTLDFGGVVIGDSSNLPFSITNSSTDPNGGDSTLTDLTLLSAVISGPDAAEFNLVGFTPGTVLNQQDLINLLIEFSPGFGPGSKDATLTFLTDEGAAFGSPGLSFSYSLSGMGTPEPASLLGFAVVGVVGGLIWRRRKIDAILAIQSTT